MEIQENTNSGGRYPRLERVVHVLGIPSLFLLVGYVLYQLLGDYQLEDVNRALRDTANEGLLLAVLLSIVNYFILTFYDTLAFRYVGKKLPYKKIAFTSYVSYTVSNTVGFSLLSGAAIRYHLYSAWGATASEIGEIIAFSTMHFWAGLFVLSGLTCVFRPEALNESLSIPAMNSTAVGLLLLFPVAGYLTMAAIGRGPVRVRNWEITLPSFSLAFLSLLVATLDWFLAALVFYALLPNIPELTFGHTLGAFVLSQFAGVVSHVPGGLGVFEAAMVISLRAIVPPVQILGALILFRTLYYFLPFFVGVAAFGAYELRKRGVNAELLRRRFEPVEKVLSAAIPPILSFVTFVGGAILLASGSTPAAENRSWWVLDLLPLPILEFSHFLNSIVAVGLMTLAWAIRRRIDSAYFVALCLLAAGILVSLIKGLDYEEAGYLVLVSVLFLPSRKYFYRKGSLFAPFNLTSIFVILGVIGVSVWIGFFTYKHVEYTHQLWWQFTLEGDASRFLRGSVGVMCIVFLLGVWQLFRHAEPVHQLPTLKDSSRVLAALEAGASTQGYLSLLRDKYLLWSEAGDAFLMYQVVGRSWIALGKPVGNEERYRELMWNFREHVDAHGGLCVFYEVGSDVLAQCVELGLDLMKLGEEALVDIRNFSLEGNSNRGFRNTLRKLEREGYAFSLVPPSEVPALLPELRSISTNWLQTKNAREKGFSLGFFDEDYLALCPMALVRKEEELVGFANVWSLANKKELSVDLMRHRRGVSNGIMDYLFLHLILWGRENGFETFNLGMAPLSGIESHRFVPIWYKAGSYLYRHGENFYNFEGVRAYKEKFRPRWEPKFLAYPGALALPRVLMNVTSLISGGVKGIVGK